MNEFQYMSGLIYGEKNESSVHNDPSFESIYDIKGLLSFLFFNRLNMNVRYYEMVKITLLTNLKLFL